MPIKLPRPLVPLALIAALAGLCGCSGMLHSDQPPVEVYTLHAPRPAVPGGAASAAATLRLEPPVAGPGLGTARIVLLRPNHRMDHYAASAWSAEAPALIEALAADTLKASGAWRSVQGPGGAFPAQFMLEISLRRFDADYAPGAAAPTVRVALDCTVGTEESRRILASFVASGSQPAAANRMRDVVAAFQQATDAALRSLSHQTALAVRGQSGR